MNDLMSEFNQPAVIRAGLIAGAINFVIGLAIAFIPPIACVACWIAPLMGLATGVLYDIFAQQNGYAIDVRRGAIGGAAAGLIVGVVGIVISIIQSMIWGYGVSAAVVSALVGPAILGAAGGALYALYLNRNAPPTSPPPAV